ncbi:zinc-dependent metalloprotease [Aquiflexum lacus]|uniref:zinc-dependent metalloprotease n=1 Tax=Aquiflexum lacus TaxID=2483805 RepID=UPI001894A3AD|nr:M43 family zinc metalloprotease [Aquiflexum lacus]
MHPLQSLSLKSSLITASLVFFTLGNSFAQAFFGQLYQTEHVHDESCGTYHFEKILEEKYGIINTPESFEPWMKEKIAEGKRNQAIQRKQENPRVIPVVVHVIHNGTPIGTGANIPLEQIESQIRVLNEDFRRLNPDASNTPAEFLPVAADAQIEFVLARQDPRGRPTDGVVRVQGPRNSYNVEQASLIWQTSLWPAEEYLNIWVMTFTSAGLRGFSRLPFSNLPGSPTQVLPEGFNGVWMNYPWFGGGGNADPESNGRTLTHEIGHFLGLHHTWGPGNNDISGCDIDDFVEDTPAQFEANNFVCRFVDPKFSCGSKDMSENFMDYTSNDCYNLFTLGQVERFDVVLAESPFRASLVNSRGTIAPARFENDLAIERLIEPSDLFCNLEFNPKVEVLNFGTNRVSSARLSISNNGNILQTKDFEMDLGELEEEILEFDPITLPATGNNIEINIILVNSVADANPLNNTRTSSPALQPEISIPYALNLDDIGINWLIQNPDDSLTWEKTELTLDGQTSRALVVKNFNYEDIGQRDFLISPRIDLTNSTNAQLTFMMAHAARSDDDSSDFLIVAVSTDCGNNFEIINANYAKDWRFLSTSELISSEFIPTSQNQFRREILDLSAYAGLSDVRVAIINQNDNGNNIYIKDLEILDQQQYRYDVTINELTLPFPISSIATTEESINITNTGNLPLSNLVLRRQTNNGAAQLYVFSGDIQVGQSVDLVLPKSTGEGPNILNFTALFPNWDQNEPEQPRQIVRHIIHDQDRIQSPWRESFINRSQVGPWISLNPQRNAPAFTLTSNQSGTLGDNVLVLQNTLPNNSYWFGTPLLDLSRSSQASILFDMAAGQISPNTVLRILGSQDAGNTYTEIWRKTGSEISTVTGPTVNPNNPSEFRREFVDLSQFTGKGELNGRMSIVIENGEESNSPIYFDNFEFFLRADPQPVRPEVGNAVLFPNPARDLFNISFNLRSFENVNIQIISSNGTMVHNVDYPNTLNQTYTFSSKNFSKGLFIIKINSRNIAETKKLFIH